MCGLDWSFTAREGCSLLLALFYTAECTILNAAVSEVNAQLRKYTLMSGGVSDCDQGLDL